MTNGALVLISIGTAAFFFIISVRSVKNRRVTPGVFTYERDRQPVLYWSYLAFYLWMGVIAVFCAKGLMGL